MKSRVLTYCTETSRPPVLILTWFFISLIGHISARCQLDLNPSTALYDDISHRRVGPFRRILDLANAPYSGIRKDVGVTVLFSNAAYLEALMSRKAELSEDDLNVTSREL